MPLGAILVGPWRSPDPRVAPPPWPTCRPRGSATSFFLSTSLTTRSLPLAPTPLDPRPFGRVPPGPVSLGPFAAWLTRILRLRISGVKSM